MSSSRRVGLAALVVLLVGALLGLVPGAAQGGPTAALATWSTATFELPNSALGYDHHRDRLLVVVDPRVPEIGNHLVELDPQTGELGRSVWIGGYARDLVVSDDASRAYISLPRLGAVAEVDLATFTASRPIDVRGLGEPGAQPWYLDVQPGNADVVAVGFFLGQGGAFGSVAVFDDGVPREDVVPENANGGQVEFVDASTLVGVKNSSSLLEMAVDGDGVTEVATHAVGATGGERLVVAGGLLHLSTGQVIDPSDWSAVGSYSSSGRLVVDAANGNTFILTSGTLSRHSSTAPFAASGETTSMGSGILQLVDAGEVVAGRGNSVVRVTGPGVTDEFQAPQGTSAVTGGTFTTERSISAMTASPSGVAVYASLDGDDPDLPEHLVEMDSATGEITRALDLEARSLELEVSADGSRLLVAAASGVIEVDLASFTVDRTVDTAESARNLAAVPGTAASYVVSGIDAGAELVIDGELLGDAIADSVGVGPVAFLDDASIAYGVGDEDLHVIDVTATGLALTKTVEDLHAGLNVHSQGQVVTAGGLLYVDDGAVIDPVAEQLVAWWPGPSSPAGEVAVAPEVDRLFATSGIGLREMHLTELWEAKPAPGTAIHSVLVAGPRLLTTRFDVLTSRRLGSGVRPPSPPRDLRTEIGDQEVVLRWAAPGTNGGSPLTQYRIFRDGEHLTTVSNSTSRYTDQDVLNGEPHLYTVVADNAVGESLKPQEVLGIALNVPTFSDVSPSHPFYEDISWAGQLGIVQGYPDGTFRPGGNVTRQALAAFVFRMYGSPEPDVPVEELPQAFPDVSRGHPFSKEIAWAAQTGIVRGYADGTFRPSTAVSRQAITAIIFRLTGIDDTPGTAPPQVFPDVPPSHPFFVEISISKIIGLVNGYADGTFRSSIPVSRQAAAAFLYRFAQGPESSVASVSGADAVNQWAQDRTDAPSAVWPS